MGILHKLTTQCSSGLMSLPPRAAHLMPARQGFFVDCDAGSVRAAVADKSRAA